jgi:hypothetical protein
MREVVCSGESLARLVCAAPADTRECRFLLGGVVEKLMPFSILDICFWVNTLLLLGRVAETRWCFEASLEKLDPQRFSLLCTLEGSHFLVARAKDGVSVPTVKTVA